jgi:hypothetical protein
VPELKLRPPKESDCSRATERISQTSRRRRGGGGVRGRRRGWRWASAKGRRCCRVRVRGKAAASGGGFRTQECFYRCGRQGSSFIKRLALFFGQVAVWHMGSLTLLFDRGALRYAYLQGFSLNNSLHKFSKFPPRFGKCRRFARMIPSGKLHLEDVNSWPN